MYVAEDSLPSDFSLNKSENGKFDFFSICGNIKHIDAIDLPKHLTLNLSFAISIAKLLNLSDSEIINGIKAITKSDLGQRFIELDDFTIFDDSYNASLESIKADLEYISTFDRPVGAFLGDVLELGNNSTSIHENIGRIAACLNIDHLYLYGKNAVATAHGAIEAGMKPENIFLNTNLSTPETSIDHIKQNHASGEIILFKASHKLRLDKIADMIIKGERTNNDK